MLPIIAQLLFLVGGVSKLTSSQFNNPPGVDTWCGKAYKATASSFDPGGWLESPPTSEQPLLDLKIYPRMNVYIQGEEYGTFIVDAALSHIHGEPYENATIDRSSGRELSLSTLVVEISVTETGLQLVGGGQNVTVNSTSNELGFALGPLQPRFDPYEITLFASSIGGDRSYVATTELFVLPKRNDGGTVTKLDSLYGGLLVQDYLSNSTKWASILPYSYYTSWDGFLAQDVNNVNSLKSLGYNIIHIIPPGGPVPFDLDVLDAILDRMDELQIWLMYDMRHTYTNLSSLTTQVDYLKTRKSMLLWYTADEPDGVGDALNATSIAYSVIQELDPYHPTSLVLNCANFHYDSYASGADIILMDPYPIGINATYSTVWDTPCNTTYGDCGCDNCIGDFTDISTRFDNLAQYQEWLGLPPKAFWGVPQAFGNESYWPRYPTPEEEVVMAMLSINHAAKGITAWNYPTTDGIRDITGALAKALTDGEVTRLILGSKPMALSVKGRERVDATAWSVDGKTLVSIVSLEYDDSDGSVTVELPAEATSIARTVWNGENWRVEGLKLVKDGLSSLEVAILLLDA